MGLKTMQLIPDKSLHVRPEDETECNIYIFFYSLMNIEVFRTENLQISK